MEELLYGKQFVEHKAKFYLALEAVEEKNIEWFKERKSKFVSQPHDKLVNHTIFSYSQNSTAIGFKFVEGSEVPKWIQKEAMDVFEQFYPKKTL